LLTLSCNIVLTICILLADDIHINPGPLILQNICLFNINIRSVHNKSVWTWRWYLINLKSHSIQIYSSLEAVCIEILNCSFTGYFLCLYRPPEITSSFLVDFHDLIENLVTIHREFFIVGDFNLHLDTQSTATSTFDDNLATFDLKQDASFSTHIHGHWLDLLITRSTTDNWHRWFIGSFHCHSRNKI